MEATSLGLGIVSLIGLFSTFFDIYDKIRDMRDMAQELEQLQECLRWESERVKYIKNKYDLDRLDISKKQLLDMTMRLLNKQLEDVRDTIPKKHIASHEVGDTIETSQPRAKRRDVLSRAPRAFRWAANDKASMSEKLARVHDTIDSLWLFALTEAECARVDFVLRAGVIRKPDRAAMMDATQYPSISKATRVKQLLEERPSSTPDASSYVSSHYIDVGSIRWPPESNLDQAASSLWAKGFYNDKPVIVEWRVPFMGNSSARPATDERRLDKLCSLLSAMHAAGREEEVAQARAGVPRQVVDFAQLQCAGWTLASKESLKRIGLIFHFPSSWDGGAQPKSLRDRMWLSRGLKWSVPPLGERFNLAYGVCNAVANILSVGWIHRAIRSENMLAFGAGDTTPLSKLYLVGYTYARPGDSSSQFSDLPQGKDWAFYRPAATPSHESDDSYIFDDDVCSAVVAPRIPPAYPQASATHDMYGLGIVLLEIGLWVPAQNMVEDNKLETFQKKVLPRVLERLATRCGVIYRDVVRMCLDQPNWEGEDDIANLGDILENLKLCRA